MARLIAHELQQGASRRKRRPGRRKHRALQATLHEPDASLTLLGRATANVLHGRRWLLLELLLCDKGVKRDYGRQGLILLCLHHGLMRELQKGGLQEGTLLRLSDANCRNLQGG